MPSKPTSIRFSDEEKQELRAKMRLWGYKELSAFIRFALAQLPNKKR